MGGDGDAALLDAAVALVEIDAALQRLRRGEGDLGWENFQKNRAELAGKASKLKLFRTGLWRILSVHDDPDGYIDKIRPPVGISVCLLALALTGLHIFAAP
jgi:hypothetical protein